MEQVVQKINQPRIAWIVIKIIVIGFVISLVAGLPILPRIDISNSPVFTAIYGTVMWIVVLLITKKLVRYENGQVKQIAKWLTILEIIFAILSLWFTAQVLPDMKIEGMRPFPAWPIHHELILNAYMIAITWVGAIKILPRKLSAEDSPAN